MRNIVARIIGTNGYWRTANVPPMEKRQDLQGYPFTHFIQGNRQTGSRPACSPAGKIHTPVQSIHPLRMAKPPGRAMEVLFEACWRPHGSTISRKPHKALPSRKAPHTRGSNRQEPRGSCPRAACRRARLQRDSACRSFLRWCD